MDEKAIVELRKLGHKFAFFLKDDASIECIIDDVSVIKVSAVMEGKAYFVDSMEIDEQTIQFIEMDDLNYSLLKSSQNEKIIANRKGNDQLVEWSLDDKTKKELQEMIDKWQVKKQKRIVKVNGKKHKDYYYQHTFKIGSETIRMIEHQIPEGQIINADYKIVNSYKSVGGVGMKEGGLTVWKYYFETNEVSEDNPKFKKGHWETAREMSYSERICFEMVSRYGRLSKLNKWYLNNKIG